MKITDIILGIRIQKYDFRKHSIDDVLIPIKKHFYCFKIKIRCVYVTNILIIYTIRKMFKGNLARVCIIRIKEK